MHAPTGTALYVHSPFCVVKCHYCDFFSVVVERPDYARYVDVLLAEARQRAPRSPRTVFIGGGTPSMLPAPELRRLLEGLDEASGFRSSASEVTLECNPESLDDEKAEVMLAGGATRLTIGFQSLRQPTLELFGRAHSAGDSFRAFETARRAGFERLGIDLIYSHPGHTRAEWDEDLEQVLALGPDHISAYNLAWEEGTPFRRWLESGRLKPLPEELELELFERTHTRLSESGRPAYEISNFAPTGQECAHNVNYWRNGPYVGLGPSAVSKVAATRFANPRSMTRWAAAVDEQREGADWSESLEPRASLGETWWLGLRLLSGIVPAEARSTAGFALGDDLDPAIAIADNWCDQGLLERAGEHYRLTSKGLPLADHVAASFLVATPPE